MTTSSAAPARTPPGVPAPLTLILLVLAFTPLALPSAPAAAQAGQPVPGGESEDPYVWLEEVESDRSMEWVEAHNRATLSELRKHPAFDSIYSDAMEALSSDERIAYPSIMGGRLYNFWTDDQHERGIWRRTTWESYLSGDPAWETILDIDALAAMESVPWTFGGVSCLSPEYDRCLVHLSRGGSDATEVRELDLATGRFVEDGFAVPESKNSVAWISEDEVLVSGDFGEGTRTTSGYPRLAKRWRRGTPMSAAETVFEAVAEDMGVWVGSLETGDGEVPVVMHRPTIFEGTMHVLGEDGLEAIDVPADADPRIVGDQLVVYLRSPWEVGGETHPEGSVVAMPYDAFRAGERRFTPVFVPDERQTVEGISSTRSHLLVNVLDEVRGQLWRFTHQDGEWMGKRVGAPDLGTISIRSTDRDTDRFFFTYSGFTQPTTLYLADEDGSVEEVRRLPEMFEADGLVVEQHEATSADGTRVPYFVVHREGLRHDGTNPTLLYAYGGFQISMKPGYSAVLGTSWLERGGVYVLANIRGGGEFGPSWWRSAQKENRQRAYDDFLAVAASLVDGGVTSPQHLGIMGGSNGGLLVGVAMTQRPELFDAVVIQVPLLDMRRYNKLLAGASWMAEYGNPDIPEEWAYIREYSPYQNVEPEADYPVPLFTTTTRDDRVHPGHARKMAAKMEAMGFPVHYYENTEGGHGSGVTPEQRARMYAIQYTYLLQRLRD